MTDPSYGVQALESPGDNEALAALTRYGLQVLADAPHGAPRPPGRADRAGRSS